MKPTYNIFIAIAFLVLLSSCASTTPKYLHAPNGLNLLQVEKKNDIKASLNYGGTGHGTTLTGSNKQQSNGISIQTVYAINNTLAIKADFYKYWDRDENLTDVNQNNNFQLFYKRQSVDLAIGYFKKDAINFNIYTGVGLGNNSFSGYLRNDSSVSRNFKANYFKWFVMPSLSYTFNENYSLSLGYKLSVLRFNNLVTNDGSLKQGFYKDITRKNSVFGDFAIDNQFSFDNLKGFSFHGIIGFSDLYSRFTDFSQTPTSSEFRSGVYMYNNRFGSIGVIADLNKLFAKKQ
jgi:hypothetical protein